MELAYCWCKKSREVCHRKATQEDMLCDECRNGCSQLWAGDPEDWSEELQDYPTLLNGHAHIVWE